MDGTAIRSRSVIISALGLVTVLLAACGPSNPSHPTATPSASPSPVLPGLLGLAGETTAPLALAGPYRADGALGREAGKAKSVAIPGTALAAVTALAQALGVPGPPISTATGLGYNLGATTGYQLTTNATLTDFNFHPNTPTDEVGTTPTVAGAEEFAESFLSSADVPAQGGVIPLPALSTSSASDRTVYFQWSLDGLPVVNILGQPLEIAADVATNQHETTQLVGITGALPYGATATPIAYPAMTPDQALGYLNSGAIKPDGYLLSPTGRPLPSPSPSPSGPTRISSVARALVFSYGTAVPVYVFVVSGNPKVGQFVTCAVAPDGCVPLRFAHPLISPEG
ncbi:MAG TPA: hypothetical protein VI138_00455 [Candidatus Dormibacteraeota bacterium]